MAKTQVAPVVAGLAVGIMLVALFASLFSSTNPIVRQLHTDLSIEGLKDTYSAGERIDFAVKATGYGTVCAYPFVTVIDLDRGGSVIFSTAENAILLPVCVSDPHSFDETWQSSQLGMPNPMIIDRIGHYKIVANFHEEEAEEYFIVDNTVNRAIDKTKTRGEVTEFLAYYPNTNVTVYFVTTCPT